MMTEKDLKSIGKKKCIEVFGQDFVDKHKSKACDCWGDENGKFNYWIGLTDEPESDESRLCSGETPYKYFINMLIDRNTGELVVTDCKTP